MALGANGAAVVLQPSMALAGCSCLALAFLLPPWQAVHALTGTACQGGNKQAKARQLHPAKAMLGCTTSACACKQQCCWLSASASWQQLATLSRQVQMEGNLVKWQKWHIRLGWNYREGVVLHNVGCVLLLLPAACLRQWPNVARAGAKMAHMAAAHVVAMPAPVLLACSQAGISEIASFQATNAADLLPAAQSFVQGCAEQSMVRRYEDQGRVRPILHRGSLVEMAVPYGVVNEVGCPGCPHSESLSS